MKIKINDLRHVFSLSEVLNLQYV